MTRLEELKTLNDLLKELIEHKDISAKITDLDFFRKVLEDLKKADDIDAIVIATEDGNVNFDDLFGSKKEKRKAASLWKTPERKSRRRYKKPCVPKRRKRWRMNT